MLFTPFKLKKTVGKGYNVDFDDSYRTKKALADLGHLKAPETGLTRYPDQSMIEGLKAFQRKNGLKTDGVMKPGGPTINHLNQTLATEQQTFHETSFTKPNGKIKGGAFPRKKTTSKTYQPTQVAIAPAIAIAIAAARLAATRLGPNALTNGVSALNAAATAQALIKKKNRNKKKGGANSGEAAAEDSAANTPYSRTEIAAPRPQIPGLTPPSNSDRSGGITEFPGEIIEPQQLDGFPSDQQKIPTPMIFEILREDMRQLLKAALENRRGDKTTILGNKIITEELFDEIMSEYGPDVKNRIEHTHGSYVKIENRYKKEEYMKNKVSGNRHSSFPDMTFFDERMDSKLRINTGKTLLDNATPIANERRQLLKMRHNGELRDSAATLPKLRPGMDINEYKRRVKPVLEKIFHNWLGAPD